MNPRKLLTVARCLEAKSYSSSVLEGFYGTVGNTPLIRLSGLSKETGCNILVKAEFLNPGGSVKDRAALYLINDAREKGLIKEGGTIVEGTAGNTGIGLAHICNSLGYKCIIFMPNTQSQEKIDVLKVLGADVRPVPAVPFDNLENYNHQAKRYAESLTNAVWTNQFDNVANRKAHIETTGPEIWNQTDGKVDAVTFGSGTGGTMAGVAMYLKSKNPNILTVLADPQGSVLYNWYTNGKLERSEGSSVTEGIGQGRVTNNMQDAPIDKALCISDKDAISMTYRLLHEDGFYVGASSGLNVASAYQIAKSLGPGHTVVTCLCDTGQRYFARLFNKNWLKNNSLLDAIPQKYRSSMIE